MLKLFIETGNAAFEDAPATELARILRKLASRIEEGTIDDYVPLFDYNGNKVGEAQFSRPDTIEESED
jgi:hypothetical protein